MKPLLLIAALALGLVSGSVGAATWKIATISPDGLAWMKQFRSSAQQLAEQTDGRVRIKIYPGGVQGDDATVLRKMRIGQLHGGVVAAGALTRFYPDLQIYNLPLQFRDYAEVDHVRKKLDQMIADNLQAAGMVTFAFTETGFAYLLSKRRVSTVADLKQVKAWIPDGDPIAAELVKAFDVSPIPLNITDVLAGLQTGLIDTVVAPPVVALALQWHDQVDFMLDLPLLYIYSTLAVDRKVWRKVSRDDQRLVRQEMKELFTQVAADTRVDAKKAFAALQTVGIEMVQAGKLDEWRRVADQSIKGLVASGEITPEAVQLYLDELRSYRSARSAGNNRDGASP
ncbi:MAG: TRAP transporter substrate-binding protein DctP [Pseudomonadales bacterium]